MHHSGDVGIKDRVTDIFVVLDVLSAIYFEDPEDRECKKELELVMKTSDGKKVVMGSLVH